MASESWNWSKGVQLRDEWKAQSDSHAFQYHKLFKEAEAKAERLQYEVERYRGQVHELQAQLEGKATTE